MVDFLVDSIAQIDPLIAIFVISMLPFIELRGGIIVAAAFGIPWLEAFVVCLIGNVLPIPFVILFGRWIIDTLEKTKLLGRYVKGYKARLIKKSDTIQKYGPLGLVTFVGIPLPGTGTWSGAVLALLLNLRLKKAVPAILAGVILAGIIMTIGSHGLFGIVRGV